MSTPGITVSGNGTTANLYGTPGDDAFAGSDATYEYFYSGAGNDWVYAGAGVDLVYADFGNDTLDGGDGTDTLDFTVLNYSSSSHTSVRNTYAVVFDLAETVNKLGYLGTKTTYNFENVSGGYGNDKLYGNGGGNYITGYTGNDIIDARGGSDTIEGNLGKDTIVGGAGADILEGYAAYILDDDGYSDQFRYSKTSESNGTTTTTADRIFGYFAHGIGSTGDKIDLSPIDANGSASGSGSFKFIGHTAFHSNSTSEVRITATGSSYEYKVEVDTDKDAGAEMTIFVHSYSELTKADFIL